MEMESSVVTYISSGLKGKLNSHFESRTSTQTNLPKLCVLGQMVPRKQGKLFDMQWLPLKIIAHSLSLMHKANQTGLLKMVKNNNLLT